MKKLAVISLLLVTMTFPLTTFSVNYNAFGNKAYAQGHYDKAVAYHQKALKIKLKKLGSEHLALQ